MTRRAIARVFICGGAFPVDPQIARGRVWSPFLPTRSRVPLMFRIDRQILDPKLLFLAKRELLLAIERLFPDTKDYSVYQRQGGVVLSSCTGTTFAIIGDILEPFAKLKPSLKHSSGRVQYPSDPKHLAWHQDVTAMYGKDGMIAWVPLDPIDGTRPTLQLAGSSEHVKHGVDPRGFAIAKDQRITATDTLTNLEIGDVVWFDPGMLHRSYSTPDMTNPRHSLDMRFSNQWG